MWIICAPALQLSTTLHDSADHPTLLAIMLIHLPRMTPTDPTSQSSAKQEENDGERAGKLDSCWMVADLWSATICFAYGQEEGA